jgi:hypothetical protein
MLSTCPADWLQSHFMLETELAKKRSGSAERLDTLFRRFVDLQQLVNARHGEQIP